MLHRGLNDIQRACGSNDVCIDTPGAPISIPAWKYAITVFFVVAGEFMYMQSFRDVADHCFDVQG